MNDHHHPDWPVSFDEFKSRRDQCKRRETIISIVWMILFFTILFVNIPFADRITEMQKEQPWIGITYGVFFFGFLILNLILLIVATNRRLKAFGLQCPACEKTLHAQLLPHVITSGRCPQCGHLLVHDHPAAQ